jgi:ArsR family metal-binding transcriptional regulator
MLLKVMERLLLLQALPKESDFLTVKLVKDLKSKLGLSEEDWKTYELKSFPDGKIEWNKNKDVGVEFEIGEKTMSIIKEALAEKDKQKKVDENHMSLFEKFFPEKFNDTAK